MNTEVKMISQRRLSKVARYVVEGLKEDGNMSVKIALSLSKPDAERIAEFAPGFIRGEGDYDASALYNALWDAGYNAMLVKFGKAAADAAFADVPRDIEADDDDDFDLGKDYWLPRIYSALRECRAIIIEDAAAYRVSPAYKFVVSLINKIEFFVVYSYMNDKELPDGAWDWDEMKQREAAKREAQ